MDQNRILITGGSGFLGTNLAQHLIDAGRAFRNVDIRRPLNPSHEHFWIEGDILERETMARIFSDYQPTQVVHLAARTDIAEKRSLEGYRVNTEGTENLLRCIAEANSVRRAVITSTMLVCGLGHRPASDTEYAPSNLYGESKALMEKKTREFGLPCTWLIIRPTTIWGPWSFRYRDEFFAVLQRGLYFHPGNRPVLKTYGYVGNAVCQIVRLLDLSSELVQGQTFYIGDPPVDLRTWADKFSLGLCGRRTKALPEWILRGTALVGDLLAFFGAPVPLTTFRMRNMTTSHILDVEKTIKATGPLPYTMDEGVRLTVAWLKGSGGMRIR